MRRVDIPTGFFADRNAGDRLQLPDEQAHYLSDVLRLGPGDTVELFDGGGMIAVAQVIAADAEVHVEIRELRKSDRGESPIRTVLFQAIPKGKRWDRTLEKATELGVNAVVPLESERTVVKIPPSRLKRRLPRWEKILASATRQCERTVVPTICEPLSPSEALEKWECDVHLLAHPGPESPSPGAALSAAGEDIESVGIWIGPEGGFSDSEVEELIEYGLQPVDLGPRILRADTAGITMLTLVQAACGDL